MMKLYVKKILLIIAVFSMLIIVQIADDKTKVVKYLFSLMGLRALIKLLKQIFKIFFKDLDDYLMK